MSGARSVGAVVLLAVSSWTLGRATLSRLQWPELRGYERTALRLTAGLGLTSLVLSLLALMGLFSFATTAVGLLAAVGLVVGARDVMRRRTAQTGSAGAQTISLPAAAVVVCALAACAGAVAPVTDDDALAYVVPIARHIAETGALRVWPDQARAMWPQAQQVVLAFVLHLGGDRLGLVTAFEWLLCIGVVSALARRVCERPEHAWPSVVIALGAPAVAFQVASAKEDLLLLAASAAAGFCLAGEEGPGELAAAGLFAGIAAGAKYPGALVAAAAVLWPLLRRRGSRVRDALIVASCAAASGGIWYGLNLWRFGNPVAPFVFGAHGTIADAASVRDFVDGYGPGRSSLEFVLAPLLIFVHPAEFCGWFNLYNPLAYAGLAGLFVAGARRRSGPLFFVAAVLYVGWFFSLQNARLLLPAAVLLAPAAADRLVPWLRRRPALQLAGIAAAALSLAAPAVVGVVRAAKYARDTRTFLARETQNYADVQWMNMHLDRGRDRVASDHKALAYLDIPSLFLAPTYQIEIGQEELDDPLRFVEACRRAHITHLFGNVASFARMQPYLRTVYRNPASRLGGVRFFREPPVEETAVFQLVYPSGRPAGAVQ